MSEIDQKNLMSFLKGEEYDPPQIMVDCKVFVCLVLKKNRYPSVVYQYIEDLTSVVLDNFLSNVGKFQFTPEELVGKCYVYSRRWISNYLRECKRYSSLESDIPYEDKVEIDLSGYVEGLCVDPIVKECLVIFLRDPLSFPSLVSGFSIFSVSLIASTFRYERG